MAGKSFIHVDGEQLKQLYEVEKLTARQIAARLGIGHRTVVRRLHKFGIEVKPPGPDRHLLLRDKEWLAGQYATKSSAQIGQEIGASFAVVLSWLETHGIEKKPQNQHAGKTFSDEARERMAAAKRGRHLGEENPNWRGGLVNPNVRLRAQPETRKWIAAVKDRDEHKCVECGATGRLHAHHVKPWKTHPELRHDVSNGAALCPPCHQKAHGWRFPAWAYHGESRTSTGHPQG